MKITVETTEVRDLVQITAEGFAGKIFRFPRHQLSLIKKSGLIDSAGHLICYVLYNDHFDKRMFGNNVYIGESSNGLGRIEDHDRNRNDWNQAIVISPDNFDMDSIYRLESDLIKRIQWSMKFKAENIKKEDRGVLCSCQIASYKGVPEQLYKIFDSLHFDVFTLNTNGLLHYKGHANCFARIISTSPPTIEILEGSAMKCAEVGTYRFVLDERGIPVERREVGVGYKERILHADFYVFKQNEVFVLETGTGKYDKFDRFFLNENGQDFKSIRKKLNENEHAEAE